MFWKNNKSKASSSASSRGREMSPSIIAQDIHILGNLVSDGVVDFAGTIDGNVRCQSFTLRPQGVVNGEVAAETAHIYGKVKGMVRAKHVHIYASSHIEGVIMHESLAIEDGAYIDGKFKRSDKPLDQLVAPAPADEGLEIMQPVVQLQQPANEPQVKVMKKNIRLITQ